jgi:hypothetical protein
MVRSGLKIPSDRFCGCLMFDFAKDGAEPCHVPVATQVRDLLPAPGPDLGEEYRDRVTA